MAIAFLFARTPDQRDVTRFAIPVLGAEQNVLLLDFSAALGRHTEEASYLHLPSGADLLSVKSLGQFQQVLLDCSVTIVIDLLPLGKLRTSVLALSRAASIHSVRHAIGPVPPLPRPSVSSLIWQNLPRLKRNRTNSLHSGLEQLRPSLGTRVDTFIGAGDASLRSPIATRAFSLISGRSLDCDENEKECELQGLPSRFSVFVDSGGPLHPDLRILGIRSSTSEADYFSELYRILNTAQDLLGLPVLVARHPRMALCSYLDRLPGFKIFDLATPELIRRSEIVFDSGSTSTSFSVLNMKPIRFLSPGTQAGDYLWRVASAFGRALGQEVHTDCRTFARSLADIYEIPAEKYSNYRRNYLFSDDHTNCSFSQEILKIASNE